jgi:hypothetical protein
MVVVGLVVDSVELTQHNHALSFPSPQVFTYFFYN